MDFWICEGTPISYPWVPSSLLVAGRKKQVFGLTRNLPKNESAALPAGYLVVICNEILKRACAWCTLVRRRFLDVQASLLWSTDHYVTLTSWPADCSSLHNIYMQGCGIRKSSNGKTCGGGRGASKGDENLYHSILPNAWLQQKNQLSPNWISNNRRLYCRIHSVRSSSKIIRHPNSCLGLLEWLWLNVKVVRRFS